MKDHHDHPSRRSSQPLTIHALMRSNAVGLPTVCRPTLLHLDGLQVDRLSDLTSYVLFTVVTKLFHNGRGRCLSALKRRALLSFICTYPDATTDPPLSCPTVQAVSVTFTDEAAEDLASGVRKRAYSSMRTPAHDCVGNPMSSHNSKANMKIPFGCRILAGVIVPLGQIFGSG